MPVAMTFMRDFRRTLHDPGSPRLGLRTQLFLPNH